MSSARLAYPCEDVWEGIFYSAVERALYLREMFHADTSEPLDYLEGAEYPGRGFASVRDGATYKSLAYIGHLVGMDGETREAWYRIANTVPLSQAHAGIIIAGLRARDEMLSGLEEMLTNV